MFCVTVSKPLNAKLIFLTRTMLPPLLTSTLLRTDRQTHAGFQKTNSFPCMSFEFLKAVIEQSHFPGYDAMYSGRFPTFGTNIDRGSTFPKHINLHQTTRRGIP